MRLRTGSEKTKAFFALVTSLACITCAEAVLVGTDPVTGGRTYRFTPDDEDFLLFRSTWNNNSIYYFRDDDVFEFEESDSPYEFTRNTSQGNNVRITFRGVKSDGSPADPGKVVFKPDSESANYKFEGGAASNVVENITFSNMHFYVRSDFNTFSNCVFTSMTNAAAIYGQYAVNGYYVKPGWSCAATGCRFENANWGGPGAIRYLYAFAATNCVFANNFNCCDNLSGGGAIGLVGNLFCKNCTFTGNYTSGAFGGAVDLSYAGLVELDGCVFSNNYVTCEIADNLLTRTSSIGGGAISMSGAVTGSVQNCLFAGNYLTTSKSPNVYGGAVRLFSSSALVSFENCTFANNTITVGGTNKDNGGAIGVANGTLAATNCIFYANHGMLGSTSWKTSHLSVKDWSLVANCLEANFEYGGTTYDFSTIDTGDAPTTHIVDGENGNLVGDYDPKFTDAANGDYTLQKKSPCRDAGTSLSWMDTESTDLAGNGRIVGNAPDIGCYEWFNPKPYFFIYVR